MRSNESLKWSLFCTLLLLGACTMVDTTEHCVETKYGAVVSEHMSTGLNMTLVTTATCFSLIEQNFPSKDEAEQIAAQTRDPVTISGDLALVFSYDPTTVYELFVEKRSEAAAQLELRNAIREGYRNALAAWTVAEIFSERREELGDSVKAHIQRKIGDRARIHTVFLRAITIPPLIEEARINAARQAQVLSQERQQFTIDSVRAVTMLMRANVESEAKSLTAEAYRQNPKLLELEIARELAKMCNGVQTCVLGGSVADTWKLGGLQ